MPKNFRGKKPTIFQTKKGYWICAWISNDDSIVFSALSREIVIYVWNEFIYFNAGCK